MSDLSIEWLTIIANASVRTLLIVAVAWMALRLLKLRDSNIRHRIWSGVLVGMICLPLLSVVLPPIPLPFEVQADWLKVVKEPSVVQAVVSDPVGRTTAAPASPAISMGDHFTGISAAEMDSQPPIGHTETLTSSTAPVESDEAMSAAIVETSAVIVTDAPAGLTVLGFVRSSLNVLFVLWIAGVATLFVRVAAGLLATTLLLKNSQRIEDKLPEDCSGDVRKRFHVSSIRLMSSDEIRVPVTVGWWKPTVLLPAAWTDWSTAKLEAVLAHETTHVQRRDFIIAVLAEVNRCLYWFHPVSWWLRRTLSDLAEEACDDAAIGLTGNAAGYARHLLEVAAALTQGSGRVVQPGMSMARESNVEGRITAILDFTRPLSRQLTRKALVILLLVTVPVIALSAALQPTGPSDDDTAKDAAVAESDDDEDASAQEQPAPVDGLHIHGQVVDENNIGIGSAQVRLYRSVRSDLYAALPVFTLVEELKVDGKGRFDGLVPLDKLPPKDGDQEASWDDGLTLVVSAPGHAHSTQSFSDYGETEALTMRLIPAVEILGRLLSLEGQPVPGVTITVRGSVRSDASKLDKWLEHAAANPAPVDHEPGMMLGVPTGEERFPTEHDLKVPNEVLPATVTSDKGEFRISGFGPDDLVLLDIMGGGVVKSTLHVLGRDIETVHGVHLSNLSRGGEFYGRTFDYITQPAVPVFGVVRDIDSKEPLPHVTVMIAKVSGRMYSHTGYTVTTTDELGRYRIDGLPHVPKARRRDRNDLGVRLGALPYIENDDIAVPARNGLDPIEFNIELKKAVLARGRLTDRETGKPVQAKLYYSPFNTNERIADYGRFSDDTRTVVGNDSRYQTDSNGYFSIPVIEGRGVLCAKTTEGSYCTEYGVSDIREFDKGTAQNGGSVTSDHIVPTLFHSLKAIDVPAGVSEFEVNLEVDPGLTMTVKFVDPNGDPLNGVSVSGAPGYRNHTTVESDSTPVSGLILGHVRPLEANHESLKLSRMMNLVPEAGQQEFVVQLFPKSVVEGRLTDPDGVPLAGQAIVARHNNDPQMMSAIYPNPKTDADGRFEFWLSVGTKYQLIGQSSQFFVVAKDLDITKPQRIDFGDLVVDPDAERWAPVKAKHEPIATDREPYEATKLETRRNEDVAVPKVIAANRNRATDSLLRFRGSVTDPDGKPFAGAKIYLIFWDHKDRDAADDEKPLAVSGADGSFEFTIDSALPENGPMPGAGTVVAVAKGFAFAHVTSTRLETTGRLLESWPAAQRQWIEAEIAKHSDVLKLGQDAPVRGRIVTTEGQPVQGATVRAIDISDGKSGDLDSWVAATKAEKADYYQARQELTHICNGLTRTHLALPPAQTNADGWFELRGLGKGRIAEIVISGHTIASTKVNVRADVGETIQLIEQWPEAALGRRTYYANEFTHVAAPSQLVIGRVTDRDSGEPVADCLIQADRIAGQQIGGRMTVGFIRTRTDADGRYKLHGLPVGECEVTVVPPRNLPYVALAFGVNGKEPAETSTRNIELVRGTLVDGTVTDERTGKPIAGRVEYAMFSTNELNQQPNRIRLAHMQHYYRSGPDGRFQIPVLPGPGVLGFNADDHQAYPRAKWSPMANMPSQENDSNLLRTTPYLMYVGNFHHVAGVDPAAGLDQLSFDFQLSSGIDVPGDVARFDGTKVETYALYGASIPGGWYQQPKADFTVQGYRSDRPQRLMAWAEEEDLVGSVLLEGPEVEHVKITLQSAGRVTGRLILENGEPIAGVHLGDNHQVNGGMGQQDADPQTRGSIPNDSISKRKLQTDEDGRFEIRGLLSGLKYSAEARGFRKFGTEVYMTSLGEVFKDLKVESGETKDIGDIVVREGND